MLRALLLLSTLSSLACGTSSQSATTPDGSAPPSSGNSGSLPADAIWVVASGHGFDFHGAATYIQLSDFTSACGFEQKGCCPGGATLDLAVASTDAAAARSSFATADRPRAAASSAPRSSAIASRIGAPRSRADVHARS